ncbi:DUF4221 family protein [Algoriphagus algorifonticola]|uniref:DUF4221 family protein n=1 Tax=Algoriphagus algorifonticola TaxID=2593007 RepID=UPI0011A92D53|nr:DUF4221 family protein [Algoriphagus algorifonticola]
MKSFLPLILALVLFSCDQDKTTQESKNVLENLSLQFDSLVVDSGDEVFAPDGIYSEDLSMDGERVFAFYEPDFEVFEISLKEMKLLNRYPFQREGPEGIKGWVSSFQALPEDQLMIYDGVIPSIYDLEGKKLKSFEQDFQNMIDFQSENPFMVTNYLKSSPEQNFFFSLPAEFGKPILGLAVFDMVNENGKVLKLPAFDLVTGFQVIFRQGNGASFYGDRVGLQLINHQLLVTCNSTAQVYKYDYKKGSMELISFEHQLVENQKSGSFPNEVDSREKQMEIANKMRQQISFENFYWDESRKLYFRFATKNYYVSPDGRERKADCYLFAYDQDLNLIGEAFLPELTRIPYNGYFYKGEFYSYWPMGDEAGFVRFQFNF